MHGLIMYELEKYTTNALGRSGWKNLVRDTGLGSRMYTPLASYPDNEALVLVQGASKATGVPVPELLEDFGRALVPGLLKLARPLLRPEWRTLDLLLHTEATMHEMVRARNAKPPRLEISQSGPRKVKLRYTSKRGLCALVAGIVHGLADHYEESAAVYQSTCMLEGDPACEFSITMQEASPRHRRS